jgi:hypothetical protein
MKIILLFLISIYNTICQLSIVNPFDLHELFKQKLTGGCNITLTIDIDYRLGNFGEVPYGKTIVGFLFYQLQDGSDNQWCHLDKVVPFLDLNQDPDGDYSPIFVVEDGGCPYSQKALNVQTRGGRAMLLISSDHSFQGNNNIDDQRGARVTIPTIIIKKEDGDMILDYIKKNEFTKITMSIKFKNILGQGDVFFQIYLRSDEPKALHFFKEFRPYYEKLCKIV